MLKRIVFVIISLSLLLLASFQSIDSDDIFFVWFSFFLLCVFYNLSKEDHWISRIFLILYILTDFLQWNRVTPKQFFLFNVTALGSVWIWFYYFQFSKNVIAAVENQKNRVVDDIGILREKYHARMESLNHLERQVGGLLDLFEAAKDFNECLYFDQLLEILDKRVKDQIRFRALSIILLPSHEEKNEIILRAMSVGKENQENLITRSPTPFEIFCASEAKRANQVIRIESAGDFKNFAYRKGEEESIVFPLWIFPLQVEEKAIAAMLTEGGSMDDFPKFELLASQLALQVKKISLYETVKELSIIDGLTKTYVRRHFLERFEEELKRAIKRKSPLSVLMLDIDHFKSYNDQFGHLVGDSTLREVAAVIKEHVRKVDLVARYGGEEFAIVMPEIGSSANVETAERIRSAIARKQFRLYDEETKVTVSIGISSFPKDLDDKNIAEFHESLMLDLIQKADKALYQAKDEGRNRVVSYE